MNSRELKLANRLSKVLSDDMREHNYNWYEPGFLGFRHSYTEPERRSDAWMTVIALWHAEQHMPNDNISAEMLCRAFNLAGVHRELRQTKGVLKYLCKKGYVDGNDTGYWVTFDYFKRLREYASQRIARSSQLITDANKAIEGCKKLNVLLGIDELNAVIDRNKSVIEFFQKARSFADKTLKRENAA